MLGVPWKGVQVYDEGNKLILQQRINGENAEDINDKTKNKFTYY